MNRFFPFTHIICASIVCAMLMPLACLGTEPAKAEATFRDSVGLQLFSLRHQFRDEGVAALDHVVRMGFKEVEAGLLNPYGLTNEELKRGLQERGLTMVSGMVNFGLLMNDIDRVIEAAKFFGVKNVGIGSAPHQAPFDEAQALRLAENFNNIGRQLKEHGLQFFYHNHGFEFQPHGDGETTFDILMRNTDPELVKFQLDVLWALLPGQDPVKLLRKYPDRWISMHLKDLAPGVPQGNHSGRGIPGVRMESAIGHGQGDFPAILEAAQEIGIKYFFIEDETQEVLTQIPKSLEFLSTIKLLNRN